MRNVREELTYAKVQLSKALGDGPPVIAYERRMAHVGNAEAAVERALETMEEWDEPRLV